MGFGLGIDLGTTFSAAAVSSEGQTRILTLGTRSNAVPSAVYVSASGGMEFGELAVQRGRTDPEGLAVEFKRRIGDPEPLRLHGSPLAAELLAAKLLRWVIDRVAASEGSAPENITVTHPASWGPYRLEMMAEVARQADLRSYRRISEPEAAALYYASLTRVPVGALIAVYDLGGGTFDATILRKLDTRFEIVGNPEGVDRLGGIDFDDAIVGFVRRSLGEAIESLDPTDPRVARDLLRLRLDCVDAKELLSQSTEAVIPVILGDVRTEVRITRREFEQMIEPVVQLTLDCFGRAIDGAGVALEEVSKVLLVGGSSRIPIVAGLLEKVFDRPIAVDAHPKDATALGAALYSSLDESEQQEVAPAARLGGASRNAVPSGGTGGRVSGTGSNPVVPQPESGLRRSAPAFLAPTVPADRTADLGRRTPDVRVGPTERTAPLGAEAPAIALRTSPEASNGSAQVIDARPVGRSPEPTLQPQAPLAPAGTPVARRADGSESLSGIVAHARSLPLDRPPPDEVAGFRSPIQPMERWGGVRSTEGRGMRVGTDGKLYSEEHAAINADRAHMAEGAARLARQQAARRVMLAFAAGIGISVVVAVVLVLLVL